MKCSLSFLNMRSKSSQEAWGGEQQLYELHWTDPTGAPCFPSSVPVTLHMGRNQCALHFIFLYLHMVGTKYIFVLRMMMKLTGLKISCRSESWMRIWPFTYHIFALFTVHCSKQTCRNRTNGGKTEKVLCFWKPPSEVQIIIIVYTTTTIKCSTVQR